MDQRSGWYDDPDDASQLRYFDGIIWTSHRQPKKSPTAAQSTIGHAQQAHPTSSGYAGWPGPSGQPPQQSGPSGPPGQPGWGQPPPQQPYGYGPAYGQGYAGVGVRTTPDGAVLASWGSRFGAFLLDYIILAVLSGIAGSYWLVDFFRWYVGYFQTIVDQTAAGGSPAVDQTLLQQEVSQRLWPLFVVSLVVLVVYQVGFLTWKGATPGKLAVGIRVRRRDRPGRPDLVTVLRRLAIPVVIGLVSLPLEGTDRSGSISSATALLGLLSFASLVAWLLDYLWPLWDERRQALHDKVAGTQVVVKDPSPR